MPNVLVRLQTEQGETVLDVDDHGVIAPLADVAAGDRSFVCWRFIREYDDTYFSAPQMNDFISELDRLRVHAGKISSAHSTTSGRRRNAASARTST